MQFVRSGWFWFSAAALALAAPAGASAQQTEVTQGSIVYVEEADGSLTPHRRVDSPGEGDGRARLMQIDESAIPRSGEPTAYLVVPRSAVLTPSFAMSTGEIVGGVGEVMQAEVEPLEVETEVATGKADAEVYAAPPPPPEVGAEIERPAIRPRLGVMALGGGMVEDVEGWLVGGALQLGVQLGDWFSIYYQPTALYAGIDTPTGGRDDAFTLWNPLLVELTLFDWVSIAGGPSADIYEECEQNAACAQDEIYFGAHGRLALNIGGMLGGMGRHAIQLSFEVHPTWFDFGGDSEDTMSISMLGGLGVQMY